MHHNSRGGDSRHGNSSWSKLSSLDGRIFCRYQGQANVCSCCYVCNSSDRLSSIIWHVFAKTTNLFAIYVQQDGHWEKPDRDETQRGGCPIDAKVFEPAEEWSA